MRRSMIITLNTIKAWTMKARLKTSLKVPTDLDAIADKLNIQIVETDNIPSDALGMHITHPEGRSIAAVRPVSSLGCRRFSLAHEICHHLIDRALGRTGVSYRSDTSNHIEYLCNQFAAELLMPEPEVRIQAEHYWWGLTEASLNQLADIFEVTSKAMEVRLRELKIPEWWWSEQDRLKDLE